MASIWEVRVALITNLAAAPTPTMSNIVRSFYANTVVADEAFARAGAVVRVKVSRRRGALFAEGPGHSSKAQKPSAKGPRKKI